MTLSSDPPLLTADLVETLLDALTRAGFPTRARLRPGLSDEQMDEIVAPLGLTLPAEARAWWSCHNGGDRALLTSSRTFAALEDMVSEARWLRDLQRRGLEDDPVVWDESLLPVVLAEEKFGCDCSVPRDAPSPIWVWIPKEAEDLNGPVLPSFGSLVTFWIKALDEGLWEYVPGSDDAVSHLTGRESDRWPYGLP